MDRDYMRERLNHLNQGDIVKYKDIQERPFYFVVRRVSSDQHSLEGGVIPADPLHGRVVDDPSSKDDPPECAIALSTYERLLVDDLLDRGVELPLGWSSEKGEKGC